MPKVSICVPAYQNPLGVKRLLDSVKEQNYRDYEVIVTDDSPDDAVKEVVQTAGISRLTYFKNEIRKGATANWNEAVRHAGGEYIKIMHHDDWFTDADSLGAFVKLLDEDPAAMLAFSGTWQVTLGKDSTEAGERFARCISDAHRDMIREDWRNLYIGDYVGAPSATIYRNDGLEYEERLTWLVDVEFYMRLLQKQPHFSYTTEPLISIGVSANQLTESCRTDGKLNIFEYGFVMREFELLGEERYRQKMIAIALKYKMPYESLAAYGIPKEEYRKAAAVKRRADFIFLLGVAKRKLWEKLGHQTIPAK